MTFGSIQETHRSALLQLPRLVSRQHQPFPLILQRAQDTPTGIRKMTSTTQNGETAHQHPRPASPLQPSKKRRLDHDDADGLTDTVLDAKKPRNDAKSSYVLERGYAATTRLNSQYLLWKMELGWSLHPTLCPSKADSP
ncbi:hypothetical protein G7Y79_00034g069430 [Physcia stellaris]|nr:hypothetical protein G7Y79_00034g069430 [Physcia stellaris]